MPPAYEIVLVRPDIAGNTGNIGRSCMALGCRLHLVHPLGYRITDASQLPDGRLLLLERRIGFPEGFTAKLLILDPAKITRDATVAGTVIATLAPPLLVDNMEGLAITQEQGRSIVWLVSDNNFNAIQRTLLMKFALNLPNKKPEALDAPGFDSL